MTMIDDFRTLSCRGEGRKVSALFCFRASSWDVGLSGFGSGDARLAGRGGSRDWVGLVLLGAQRLAELGGPGGIGLCGFFLRRLFDNFIGRKRDVDGGVLAGLFCANREVRRDKLTVTFQTTIPVGLVGSPVVRRSVRL
jgi:hypothetical protein